VTKQKTVKKSKPILVLLPATGHGYDGTANFLGKFDKVVVAGGEHLPSAQIMEEAAKEKRFVAAVQLWHAHTTRNARSAQQALEKLYGPEVARVWDLPSSGDLFPALPQSLRKQLFAISPETWQPRKAQKSDILDQAPRWHLPKEFTAAMKSARLVLWYDWKRKRFLPAIYCPNLTTALYVLASLQELHACPACNKPFVQIRTDQEYCSIACRERFRQQRRREKLSIKGAKT
jgi:predicted nucleic acid-binding Zn ribbon protein